MLRIRFFTVAAATLSLASIIGADGANAQNAATDQSTAPLSLMHLFSQPAAAAAPEPAAAPAPVQATTTRPRRVVSRRHRIASRKTAHGAQSAASSADPEQSNASADAWLTASAPAASTPAPAAAPDSAQRDAASPSALVIGGQTVQIAEANQVNEIDLAAASAPPEPSPSTQPADADLPRSDRADTVSASDSQAAPTDALQGSGSQVSQTAFVAPTPDGAAQIADGGTMGPPDSGAQDLSTQNSSAENSNVAASAALIAQVLAALGGALTAGILAWFLIGGAEPTRNYG